jgi:hypothetical protein
MAQDRMTGMMNQPQIKSFAAAPQDQGTASGSPILPAQMQLNRTMGMALGGPVNDELAGIKDTIRAEFAARGLDFDRFVSNPAVMDEVGKSIQSQGKNGDTILAHINPQEAELLKEMGGSGTVNPATGLPQFYFGDISSYGGSSPSNSMAEARAADRESVSGYSGSSGNGNDGGGRAAGIAADRGSVSGYTGGGGGSSNNLMAAARSADRGSVSGYSSSGGGVAPVLSPTGVGGGSIPMGQRDAQTAQTNRPEPSVPSYDLMSGAQIGGANNLSNLGQLAAVPAFTGATIAPQPTSVDLGNTAPQLSDIDFSNISPGMYQGATMPGGISNYGASPINPGYTDTGVTAMRMAAGLDGRPGTIDKKTGIGYGTEFYLNQLGELAPVAQTPGATILNRMIDEGYNPAFGIYSVGRTNLEQAMLQAGADGNLTAAPGRSMHNFGLAMDVKNLPDQGYRDLANIAKQEGWGWGTMKDPAHVQMAPWGAGAAQTARRLGAEPFTGPATTASMFTPAPKEQNALNQALDTVSNIAGELFGVKSAQAEEVPQQNELLDNLRRSTSLTGAEPMSPFAASGVAGMAFPPQSQQQMLDVLGIGGSPIPTERAAPPEQVAGSGVFPSYPKAAGTQAVPVAGKIGTDPQSGRDLFVDINSNEFTVNPGTGARQYTKFSTSTPASPVSVAAQTSPTNVTRSVAPVPQTVVTGLPPVQKVQDRAPGVSTAGLTGFEAALGKAPVAQAASLGLSPTGLTGFEAALGTTPVAQAASLGAVPTTPRITTGITSPLSIGAATMPRQEPLDPTQSTSPITAEQLKELGVYQTPLKEGQRVRDNFNEAYGDATKNKIEVFEWTNPVNGKTEFYKSGYDEADLPAKTAKTASLIPGQPAAPQTEYEKTVATLEANDMIANGMSKEEYADFIGVPVDQVKTRITTQFGPPMAEYYTKTVLESLAGMTGDEGNFAGLMNLTSMFSPLGILGLAGKAGYNAYRKRSENKADGGYVSPLASMGKK